MDCIEVRSRLASARGGGALDEAVRHHLERCEACRSHAQDLKLARLLRDMPVPPTSDGFQTRVDAILARAPVTPGDVTQRPAPRWPMAIAAGVAAVLIAAAVTVLYRPAPNVPALAGSNMVVHAQPGVTRTVSVSVKSPRPLQDATITLTLDDNLVLKGRPGVHSLSWRTSLAAGDNRIALPLTLQRAGDGNVTIAISAGGSQRALTVALSSHPVPPETI